ncbi:MAG: acetate--CoA ligase family protein [Alphaproteobacteria bacterium]|nr:acetate--CoA ligase family protein [Alphaproteobacteria bacterium]
MNTLSRPLRRHQALQRLLHPANIAVIGASPRPGAFGAAVLRNLGGYDGRVYPVNARYQEIGELVCYPTIGAVPERVDCALIATARDAVEPIVRECVAAGVGGAIVFASGYAETGRAERTAEQSRLADIAHESGMALLGPNTVGIVNALCGAAITFMDITPVPRPAARAIGLVSQSGALGMALAQAVTRGVSFSHVLTSGNSCDIDMADCVAYLADDPACAVIACLFEGMSAPERLLAATELAWQADKPLVVFKMATGKEGATAALSHTGSLAGSYAAYRAAFRRAGVVLVEDYESLIPTASFFAKAPKPTAPGVAVVAASGGSAIMAADRAEQHGVPLPQPNREVRAILEARIPEFGAARNPCDVTAQVINDPNSLIECVEALLGAPEYGALAMPAVYSSEASIRFIPVYDELAGRYGKIICSPWQSEWRDGPGAKAREQARNIALFPTVNSCFAALAAANWRAAHRAKPRQGPRVLAPPTAKDIAARLIAAAAAPVLTEREAKAALARYGISCVEERLATDRDGAIAAARALGFPVVLKALSPDLLHKTEAGVIHLNLKNAAEVGTAHDAILGRVAAQSPAPRLDGVLVQKMVPHGVEVIVGGRVDPLFGPLVVVGLGGVLVEVLQDTALAPAPIGPDEAKALLHELRAFRLLQGYRGLPAVDLPALCDIVCRASEFIADQCDLISEFDLNPLICTGSAITAVDALIVRAELV